jgi:uncharacterized membrane protein
MPPKSRLLFLDLLRGWAVLVMIEVHVFNAFLRPEIRSAAWFSALNYINGLVAPSFITISGFVFMVAAERKMESYRSFGPAFWKQLFRIALVWIVGYFLHLPFFSLHRTLTEATPGQWSLFYQVDVLHTIAFGLLFLFLTRLAIPETRQYKRFLVAAGAVVVCLAPFVWDIDFSRLIHPALAAYINGSGNSLFPVFPWIGFMLFGGYAATGFVEARAAGNEEAWMKRLLWVGFALIVLGGVGRQLPIHVPWLSSNVRANPLFFIERFGIVMILLWLCRWWTERFRTEQSFVLDAGRESLVVYTAHLMVIYGQYLNDHSPAFYEGGSHGIPECIAGTLLLALAMVLLAQIWGWLKRDHPPMARLAFTVSTFGVAAYFILH